MLATSHPVRIAIMAAAAAEAVRPPVLLIEASPSVTVLSDGKRLKDFARRNGLPISKTGGG